MPHQGGGQLLNTPRPPAKKRKKNTNMTKELKNSPHPPAHPPAPVAFQTRSLSLLCHSSATKTIMYTFSSQWLASLTLTSPHARHYSKTTGSKTETWVCKCDVVLLAFMAESDHQIRQNTEKNIHWKLLRLTL